MCRQETDSRAPPPLLSSDLLSVFKGIFGSKEAADAFLATEDGKALVSKLATIESRDVVDAPEKRLSWGKAAAGVGAAVVGWFTTKEGRSFDSKSGSSNATATLTDSTSPSHLSLRARLPSLSRRSSLRL